MEENFAKEKGKPVDAVKCRLRSLERSIEKKVYCILFVTRQLKQNSNSSVIPQLHSTRLIFPHLATRSLLEFSSSAYLYSCTCSHTRIPLVRFVLTRTQLSKLHTVSTLPFLHLPPGSIRPLLLFLVALLRGFCLPISIWLAIARSRVLFRLFSRFLTIMSVSSHSRAQPLVGGERAEDFALLGWLRLEPRMRAYLIQRQSLLGVDFQAPAGERLLLVAARDSMVI